MPLQLANNTRLLTSCLSKSQDKQTILSILDFYAFKSLSLVLILAWTFFNVSGHASIGFLNACKSVDMIDVLWFLWWVNGLSVITAIR